MLWSFISLYYLIYPGFVPIGIPGKYTHLGVRRGKPSGSIHATKPPAKSTTTTTARQSTTNNSSTNPGKIQKKLWKRLGSRLQIFLFCVGALCCLATITALWIVCESSCGQVRHTVEPVLKDHTIGHKNVVNQDRWSLVT